MSTNYNLPLCLIATSTAKGRGNTDPFRSPQLLIVTRSVTACRFNRGAAFTEHSSPQPPNSSERNVIPVRWDDQAWRDWGDRVIYFSSWQAGGPVAPTIKDIRR
jgi:hypothetical protein